jgi:hypothetical protein
MIVKCLRIYSSGLSKVLKINRTDKQTVGKTYQVLEIYTDKDGTLYRVIPDDNVICDSMLVRACDFEIVEHHLPKNWVVRDFGEGCLTFGPKRWLYFEGWDESFWQDFSNSTKSALECYEEELKIIQATDNLDDYQ